MLKLHRMQVGVLACQINLRLDAQWTGYIYDGNVFGHPADYNEFYLFLHYRDLITGRISVAEDYYGLGSYAIDYALTGRYPITDALQFSATFGYAQTQAVLGSDYPYWDIGLAYSYRFLTLSIHYLDSSETFIDPVVSEKSMRFLIRPRWILPLCFQFRQDFNQQLLLLKNNFIANEPFMVF